MARTPAAMGDGTLSTSLSVIVGPVPAGQVWYVTKIDGVNTHTAAVDVKFYINASLVTRRWTGGSIDALGGSYELLDHSLILDAGDMILAQASVTDVVTYYAAGIKESA